MHVRGRRHSAMLWCLSACSTGCPLAQSVVLLLLVGASLLAVHWYWTLVFVSPPLSCQIEEVDLKPNGGDIDVTESNRKEYIKWVFDGCMDDGILCVPILHTLINSCWIRWSSEISFVSCHVCIASFFVTNVDISVQNNGRSSINFRPFQGNCRANCSLVGLTVRSYP